jgi:hypothetical protein
MTAGKTGVKTMTTATPIAVMMETRMRHAAPSATTPPSARPATAVACGDARSTPSGQGGSSAHPIGEAHEAQEET